MAIPARHDIVSLGRVSDEDKYALLEAADVLVLPSHLESLGIVLLEAWQVGTPCLVSAKNKVTSGQVARAGGGAAYDRGGFARALATVLADRELRRMHADRQAARAGIEVVAADRALRRLVELAGMIEQCDFVEKPTAETDDGEIYFTQLFLTPPPDRSPR